MNDDVITFDNICDFVVDSLSIEKSVLEKDTRLGEDLEIVGDDAQEFLDAFSKKFNVDFSQFEFNEHFPSESSSDMHWYLSKHRSGKSNIGGLKILDILEQKYWRFFSKGISFRSITLEQLYKAAKCHKWIKE